MKINLLITLLLGVHAGFAQELEVNAGNDTLICRAEVLANDTIILGGDPTATGGTPPYTYRWYTAPIVYEDFPTLNQYTEDWLSDSTIANPILFNLDTEEPARTYWLEVSDSIGNKATSSVNVRVCGHGPVPLGNSVIFPTVGDTVTFTAGSSYTCDIDSISWSHPSEFIVGSPNGGSITVIIDQVNFVTPKATIHSSHCEVMVNIFNPLVIEVYPLGIQETGIDEIKVFPNPNTGSFNLSTSDQISEIIVRDLTGRTVYKEKPMSATPTITHNLPSGTYLVQIDFRNQSQFEKIMVE